MAQPTPRFPPSGHSRKSVESASPSLLSINVWNPSSSFNTPNWPSRVRLIHQTLSPPPPPPRLSIDLISKTPPPFPQFPHIFFLIPFIQRLILPFTLKHTMNRPRRVNSNKRQSRGHSREKNVSSIGHIPPPFPLVSGIMIRKKFSSTKTMK